MPSTHAPLLAPSMLAGDHANLAASVRLVEDLRLPWLHCDIMDGHFVPNLTFGWKTVEAIRRVTALPFDAHLMIDDPLRWGPMFVDAGCESVTFHVEVEERQVRPALEQIRGAGRLAGLSVKPATPLAALDPYRDLLDLILVMTVEPGFGGQRFMTEVAEAKLAAARAWLDPSGACEVQVDGGGRAATAEVIGRGGTDVIVSGSALYRAQDMAAEVAAIKAIANAARAAAGEG